MTMDAIGSEDASLVTFRVPIGGMFPSLFEFAEFPTGNVQFSRLLEPDSIWRHPTDADTELIRRWFEFFKDFHADEDVQRGIYGTTVLVGERPEEGSESYMLDWGKRISSLVIGATLYTRHASIRSRACTSPPKAYQRSLVPAHRYSRPFVLAPGPAPTRKS